MKNLWFAFLGMTLVWAGHAPIAQSSHPSFAASSASAQIRSSYKGRFWKRLVSYIQKPIVQAQALLKRLLPSDQDLIRLLIIILIVALLISIVVWLLPWPLDVIIMVLALVVALIFLMRYLQ